MWDLGESIADFKIQVYEAGLTGEFGFHTVPFNYGLGLVKGQDCVPLLHVQLSDNCWIT